MPDTLPQAIRSQLENAQREYSELYGAEDTGDTPRVIPAPDPLAAYDSSPSPTPATTSVVQQVKQANQGEEEDQGTDDQGAPDSDPAQAQAQAQTTDPEPWEQRYRVLQGKYDAEVPRLQRELHEARVAVDSLTAQVQQIYQAQQAQQAGQRTDPNTTGAPPIDGLFTPDEEQAYGSDYLQMVERVARRISEDAAARRAEELRAHMQRTEQSLAPVMQEANASAYERFLAQVSQQMPDWQQINADPGWLGWLGEVDPMLGTTRQSILDQASQARDAARVVAIFNAFKAQGNRAPQQPAGPQAAARQVVPHTSGASTAQQRGGNTARVFTESDIKALFAAKRKGEFTSEEWAGISAQIDSAVAEGRVI